MPPHTHTQATMMRFSWGCWQTLAPVSHPGPSPAWGGATKIKGPGGLVPGIRKLVCLLGPSPAHEWVYCPRLHWLCAPLSLLLQTPSSHMHEGKGHAWTVDSEILSSNADLASQ